MKWVHGEDKGGYHLARLGGPLYVADELLLALLELRPLAIELALGFGQGALVLPQSLSRCDRPSEQSFLWTI